MELHIYKANVLRVVDGDTIDVQVDLGMRIYHSVRLRLLDYDTPERKEKGFEESKEYVTQSLNASYNKVYIKTEKKDGFGRWLAHVWLTNPLTGVPIEPTLNVQMVEYLHNAGLCEYEPQIMPARSMIIPDHRGLEFFGLGEK